MSLEGLTRKMSKYYETNEKKITYKPNTAKIPTFNTPTPIPQAGQSNNPPSVTKPVGANTVGMASADLGAGVAKKQTIPVNQRQFGIGMQQTKAQPQRLPYAGKVSANLPQYNAVTPSGGSKVPVLPYYQEPGISSDTWKKQAEQLKQDVAQQQKTVRPWQNTSPTMQTASYLKTPQAFQKDGRAMSIEKPASVVANEQKLSALKADLANAQNQGYFTDYSEQWRAIESREDAEDVKSKLARMASMKNSIGTDMGQNIAAMNEYQRLRGELENKGINAEGVSDWLRRNSNVMEAYYQQQRDAARADAHPIIESLKTVPQVLYGGNGVLSGMTQSAMNSRTGEYRPIDTMGDAFDVARSRQTVRGTVGDNIGQWVYDKTGNQNMANTAKFLYGTAMSGADSWFMAWLGGTIGKIAATGGVPAAATGAEAAAVAKTASDAIEAASAAAGVEISTGALSNISSIILGSNAATESVMDMVNRGGSTDQAVASGVLAWATESIFEKVSIEGLITKWMSDSRGFKAFIKNAFLQGASEASEEMATEIANVIADYYVNGGLSEIEQMRQSGMTDAQITNEIAKRVGAAGAGGFLMGFVGGGAATLMNNTTLSLREQRALNALAEKTGVNIQIDDDIKGSNGYLDRSTNTLHISRNSNNAVYQVAAHEIAHLFESNAAEWNQLYEIANANLSEDARAKLEYVLQKTGYTGAQMQSEVVSHYVQQCVTDIRSFEQLVGVNRSLAQRIADAFDSFIRKITMQRSVGGQMETEYLREIMGDITPEQAQQTLEQMKKALDSGGETTGEGTMQSKKMLTDGSSVVVIPTNIFEGKTGKKHEIVADYIADHIGEVYTIIESGQKVYIGEDLPGEYTHSKATQSLLKRKNKSQLNAKNQATQEFGELIEIATNRRWEEAKDKVKHAKDAKYGFYKYDTKFAIPANNAKGYEVYNATLLIRNDADGKKYLYDILGIKENSTANLASTFNKVSQRGAQNAQAVTVSNSNNTQNGNNVNTSNSLKLTDQEQVRNAAEAAGYNIHAYHGTGRADRVGNVFLPERATSGPMAFFTDNREIAENYARNKRDTSMAYDPDFDRYETQFRIKAGNLDIPLYRAWGYLPFDARARITKKAGQLRENWDGDGELMLDPNTNEANGGFQWQLKNTRGNAIQALIEQWLNSGNLFNEESRFLDVLEMAGVAEEFKKVKGMGDLYFKDPNARYEKVYDTFLKINNPFDTANVDEQFIADLESWYEEQDQDQYVRENMESDMWDKNGIDAYDFAERLRSDLENGTTHAWTSIPDSVTDYLKHLGFDGIKDAGGKNGGDSHIVWIPFSSEQVKSAEAVTRDDSGNVIPLEQRFDPAQSDIRYSRKLNREALQEMADWKRAGLPYAPGYVPKQQLPRAEQTHPQQIPYNPSAQAAETPVQPTLPMSEELNVERQENAQKPNLTSYGENTVGSAQVNPESYAHLQNEYGTVEPGENPARTIDMPKKDAQGNTTSLYARTVAESESMPDSMVPEWEEAVASGEFSHVVASDKSATAYAERQLSQGWDNAMNQWKAVVNGERTANKNDIALGQLLLANAMKSGDTKTAMKLTAELCAEATRAGQNIQAMRLLKKMTPEGQLYYLQKTVNNLNNDFRGRKGFTEIKINEDMAARLANAKDRQEMDAVVREIQQDIADQTPINIWDRINSWRYFAMLFNPTTHIRNVAGNAVFYPAVSAKNMIASRIEAHWKKNGRLPEATKATLGKADKPLLDFAKSDYENVVGEIQGEGKYNDKDSIMGMRRTLGNGILGKLNDINTELLDKEDKLFSRSRYRQSLASYMKANNITVEQAQANPNILNKARSYAIKEAQKGTYRDNSAVANYLNQTKRKLEKAATNKNNKGIVRVGARIGEMALDGVLTFTKTPINIVKRGVEYSPAGLIRGAANMAFNVKNGKVSANEAIDQFAAGCTGTMVVAIGALLSGLGALTGGSDEDDKLDKFAKMLGEKNYAFNPGAILRLFGIDAPDTYYTIDWMAPVALPLFVGVEAQKSFAEKNIGIADWLSALSSIADPIVELSMLSSLDDALSSVKYGNSAPSAITANLLSSYAGQLVPTVGGKFERTFDGTSRQTYYDPNLSTLEKTADVIRQKAQAKIPYFGSKLQPRVDMWGREQKNVGGNGLGRFAYNMLSPGYYSTENVTDVDKELQQLYDATGEKSVLPSYAAKTFSMPGDTEDVKLNAKEYTQYAKDKGNKAYDIFDDLIDYKSYQSMSNDEKVEVAKKVYEYANAVAKSNVSDYQLRETAAKIQQCEKAGIPAGVAIVAYVAQKDVESDKDEKGNPIPLSASKNKKEAIDGMTPFISKSQRELLYELFGVSGKVW